jgi:hypothetical protein
MSKSTNEEVPRPRDERAGWLKEMQTHFSQTGFYLHRISIECWVTHDSV